VRLKLVNIYIRSSLGHLTDSINAGGFSSSMRSISPQRDRRDLQSPAIGKGKMVRVEVAVLIRVSRWPQICPHQVAV
jgi:hypothetical protein